MRSLLQIEKCLNDIYKVLDPQNKNISDEEKLKKGWTISIEALEYIEALRKDVKKFANNY